MSRPVLSSLFQVNTQIDNVCIALGSERISIPGHLFVADSKKEEKEDMLLLKGKVI